MNILMMSSSQRSMIIMKVGHGPARWLMKTRLLHWEIISPKYQGNHNNGQISNRRWLVNQRDKMKRWKKGDGLEMYQS